MHSTLVKYTLLAGANVLFALALYSLITGPVGQIPALMYSLLVAGVALCVYGLVLIMPTSEAIPYSGSTNREGSRAYALAS